MMISDDTPVAANNASASGDTPPLKRGRSRPRKSQAQNSKSAKRGRPPAKSAAAVKGKSTAAPRRGRPKGAGKKSAEPAASLMKTVKTGAADAFANASAHLDKLRAESAAAKARLLDAKHQAELKAAEIAAQEKLMARRAAIVAKAEIDQAKAMAEFAQRWIKRRAAADEKRIKAWEKRVEAQLSKTRHTVAKKLGKLASAIDVEPVKKRPGRPKGSVSKKAPVAAKKAVPTPAAKPRGRKPKAK
jgi:hypothetical protein